VTEWGITLIWNSGDRSLPISIRRPLQARSVAGSFNRPRAAHRAEAQRASAVVPFLHQLLSQRGLVHFRRHFHSAENHLRVGRQAIRRYPKILLFISLPA
jgi:hypothetical protein